MPIQVDGALRRAPCPVPSCPACEPNTGSVHPNLPAKAPESSGADIVMQSTAYQDPLLRLSDESGFGAESFA